MKCEQGDKAIIIFSIRPENIGRIVNVKEYIGKFQKGEKFQFRGMSCQCIINDHYWWIEADDLSIGLGPSPVAYIADSWLEPIFPNKKEEKAETFEEFTE